MSESNVVEVLKKIRKAFHNDSYWGVKFALNENKNEGCSLYADTILVETLDRHYINSTAYLLVDVNILSKIIKIKMESREVAFHNNSYVFNDLMKKGFDVGSDTVYIKFHYHDIEKVEDAIIDNVRMLISSYKSLFSDKEIEERKDEFLAARKYLISIRTQVDYGLIKNLLKLELIPDVKRRLIEIKSELLNDKIKEEYDYIKEYFSRIGTIDNVTDNIEENNRLNKILFGFYALGDHTVMQYGYCRGSKGVSLGLTLYCRYYAKCGLNPLIYEDYCLKIDRFEKCVLNEIKSSLVNDKVTLTEFKNELETVVSSNLKKTGV